VLGKPFGLSETSSSTSHTESELILEFLVDRRCLDRGRRSEKSFEGLQTLAQGKGDRSLSPTFIDLRAARGVLHTGQL
jgi:hypothetical protein